MAEGELLQLERSFDTTVTEAHYFAVIERKSAVLLSVATEVGAILGGVTRGERRKLRDFGRELGLAFQLRDDALDYEQGEDTLGKRRYTDLHEGKITLPLLLALKRCTPAERDAVKGAVLKTAGARRGRRARSRSLTGRRGGGALPRRRRHHQARRAPHDPRLRRHRPFSGGRAKEDLLAAARYAVGRDR